MIESNTVFKRTTLLFTISVLMILSGRLFWLQIVKQDFYRDLSAQNRIRIVKKKAARGLIRDRNGNVIVGNRPAYSISALPFEFKPLPEVISRIAELTETAEEDILEKYEKPKGRLSLYTPIRLVSDIPMQQVAYLEEHSEDFPGVTKEIAPVRDYLEGSIAPHVIGYTGQIDVQELRDRYGENLKPGDIVGKSGVEKQYDNFLRGEDGVHYIEVKVNGEVVGPASDFEDIPAVSGADLYLSIDKALQHCADSLMDLLPYIERGCFIAMDPRNGDILAMTSKPDFDLEVFTKPVTDSVWQALNDFEMNPLINRSIQGTYPPASGLKLIGTSIAIDKGYTTRETKMTTPCHGRIFYGDRYYNCWYRKGHGDIDLMEAVAYSCDVYFYQLGLRIGIDDWSYFTQLSGFGERTGIDLPSEASGFVPDRAYFTERYGRMGWGYGVILNLIIGQGETLATPLQLLSFFAALSQGGAIYRPRVVSKISPPFGRSIVLKPHSTGRLPFSEDAISANVDACVMTVNDPDKTGVGAFMEDIVVAGKTGTAQNPHGASHAWFVSFAPADNPRVALLILVENGGSGGHYAFLHRFFYDYFFNYWERGFARY